MIEELCDQDEQIIKDRKEILKMITSYYENLYSLSEALPNQNSLFLDEIPKLCKENRDICEGRVS